MVQATDRKERRKEKPVPQPEPLVKVVKTNEAGASFGVRVRREMHIAMVARTFMGANQRTIWCKIRVAREQIMPETIRTRIERRTI